MDDPEAPVPSGPACTKLQDLPPEVIGRSARYLAVRGGDLNQLVTVVAGRRSNVEKSVIKRVYLRHNLEYLRYVSDVCTGYLSVHAIRARRHNLGEMCRQWMEVNDDWRNSIKPYQGIDMPGMFADVELKAIRDEAVDIRDIVEYDSIGHICFRNTDFLYGKKEFRRYAVIVGIDGRDVSGRDSRDVINILDEGRSTPTKLRLMTSRVSSIFLNPALSIDLGLVEILRYLVEDVEIDVNSQNCTGLVFGFGGYVMPLIAHALVHPDPASFQYLLTLRDINANPQTEFNDGTTFLHTLKDDIEYALGDSSLDVTRVESLLGRDEVNVDVLDEEDFTPLECLLERYKDDVQYERNVFLLAKTFLDAGATRTYRKVMVIYDGRMRALLEAKDRDERDRIFARLYRGKRKRDN